MNKEYEDVTNRSLEMDIEYYEGKKTLRPSEHAELAGLKRELRVRQENNIDIHYRWYVWTELHRYGPFDSHADAKTWMEHRYGPSKENKITENRKTVASIHYVLSNDTYTLRTMRDPV